MKSTVTALLSTVDNWLIMLDEGREIAAIFFSTYKRHLILFPTKYLWKLQQTAWSKYQHPGLGRKLSYFQEADGGG